jgi:hypothetical protein
VDPEREPVPEPLPEPVPEPVPEQVPEPVQESMHDPINLDPELDSELSFISCASFLLPRCPSPPKLPLRGASAEFVVHTPVEFESSVPLLLDETSASGDGEGCSILRSANAGTV